MTTELEREQAIAELEHDLSQGLDPPDLQRLESKLRAALEDQQVEVDKAYPWALDQAWIMGAKFAMNTVLGRETCRVCGCRHFDPCEEGCGWAEPGLCTACDEAAS